MSPRPYRSDHRTKQAEQTRQRILEALVEQVTDTHRQDFSIAEVAERAGVSERTVYRHFPTREALIDAVGEHFRTLPGPPAPLVIDKFPAHIGDLYRWFAENSSMVEASHVAGLGRELHQRSRAERGEQTRAQLNEALSPLSEAERRKVFAVVRTMFGSANWRAMKHDIGLSDDEAAEAAEWVASLVVKDVQRMLRAAKKRASGEEE